MSEITLKNGRPFQIPDPGSPCDLWRNYFKRLKAEFGPENAKMLWLITWSANGSSFCTTNADFNAWLQRNDIDVSSALTRAVADVSAIGGSILGLGKNVTKLISIGVPVVLGVALLGIVMMIWRSAQNHQITDLAMLHPAGRAAKAGGAL